MEIGRATLNNCSTAEGMVVVIDVIRAFTTAAYALAAGVQEIFLVSTLDEAFALRDQLPGACIAGEVEGRPVPGFDYWNSPAAFKGVDLSGQRLILRTSAGTQGVVLSTAAQTRLATSLCVASATARLIRQLGPQRLAFIETGVRPGTGDEDTACADYIEALLSGGQPDPSLYTQRVLDSPWGRRFADPGQPEWPVEDLECCAQIDTFDFAMQVYSKDGRFILYKVELG